MSDQDQSRHTRDTRPSVERPSVAHGGPSPAHRTSHTQGSAPRPSRLLTPGSSRYDPSAYNSQTLITRRRFLLGAAGAGAFVAAGVAATTFAKSGRKKEGIETLKVPVDNVFTVKDYTEGDLDAAFTLDSEYLLPYGSLVFCTDDAIACCLIPTQQASPLVQVSTLALSTGNQQTVLRQAVGSDDGFEIYDARATSRGIIWMEADIFAGTWNIYCASLGAGSGIGAPQLIDSGDASVQTPSLAAVGDRCVWTVAPQPTADDARKGTALLKAASFTAPSAAVLWQGKGSLACPLYAASDGVVLTARHPESTRYYQLLHINATTGEITDSMTLPGGMRPIETGWGKNGFSFCFDAIYDYGEGIANLGTYAPATLGDSYSDASWFRFGRTPLAAPAWCGDKWFIVKSTTAVSAINLSEKLYVSFGNVSGSTNWGDYLATSGTHDHIVTYATIDQMLPDSSIDRNVKVRVWSLAHT